MAEIDIQSAITDIETVYVSVSSPDFEKDAPRKLKAFKKIIQKLRELYKSDTESFVDLYKQKLIVFGNTTCSNFIQTLKLLQEDLMPVYLQDEYTVISKDEWKRKIEDNFSTQEIKMQDKKLADKINKRVERAVIKEMLCNPEKVKSVGELRIVIIGKTGVGKSATGNLIIGKSDHFRESYQAKSSTDTVQEALSLDGRRLLRVLDTPGLFDTNRGEEEIRLELAKCFSVFNRGVHAFILVLNAAAPRFTDEEQKAVSQAKKIFGEEALNYCLLVLTHFDELEENRNAIEFQRSTSNAKLRTFVQEDLSGRVMFIDNHAEYEYEKGLYRKNMISMVDKIQENMKGNVYTNVIFKQARMRNIRLNEIDLKIRDSIVQKKLDSFYRSLLLVRKFIREKSYVSVNCRFDNLKQVIEDTEREMSKKIQIFSALPGVLEKVCEAMLEEETKCCLPESRENDAKADMRKQVDLVLLNNSSMLASEDLGKSIPRVIEDVSERLSKKSRQFIEEKMVKSHIENILECPLVKQNKELIETVVKDVNVKIYESTKEYVMKHALTKEHLKQLKKGDNKDLAEQIIDKIYGQLSGQAKDFFPREELLNITQDKIAEKYAEFEDIATEGIKKEAPCFPGNVTVITLERKQCPISELKIGDHVLTVDGTGQLQYEDIILLSHADQSAVTFHISITLSADDTLCLSPTHMIHVGRVGNITPAYKVLPGDSLFIISEMSGIQQKKVKEVSRRLEKGLFCPHTASGSIVVNGVLVSCYTENFDPNLAHFILTSINFLYKVLPIDVFKYLYGSDRLFNTPKLLEILKPRISALIFKDVKKIM